MEKQNAKNKTCKMQNGNSPMRSTVENSSVSVQVKFWSSNLHVPRFCSRKPFSCHSGLRVWSVWMQCPRNLNWVVLWLPGPHWTLPVSPCALRQLCSSRVISLPLGLVVWVFDCNALLHVCPSTSLRPICLAEGIGLLQPGAALMCCRPSFNMLSRELFASWAGLVRLWSNKANFMLHRQPLVVGCERMACFLQIIEIA